MLEKEPRHRFDINQVDEAIKRINIKSKDIFEGNIKDNIFGQTALHFGLYKIKIKNK
jgi:hypothetical protein